MILRKYMSLLGIGSARIDLILPKETFHPGEYVNGYYLIKGGTIEQQLKRIDCDLIMTDPSSGIERVIDSSMVLTSKLIEADECSQVSFTFKLLEDIPFTSENRIYHFKTRLTFDEGVESKDQDVIQIIPHCESEN